MRRWPLAVIIGFIVAACGSKQQGPHGDIERGDCRTDADCPPGQMCVSSSAHLRNASDEIVGDEILYACQAPPAADAAP